MSNAVGRKSGYVAAVVFAIAAAWTPQLPAQGGRQLSRVATPAASPAAAAAPADAGDVTEMFRRGEPVRP